MIFFFSAFLSLTFSLTLSHSLSLSPLWLRRGSTFITFKNSICVFGRSWGLTCQWMTDFRCERWSTYIHKCVSVWERWKVCGCVCHWQTEYECVWQRERDRESERERERIWVSCNRVYFKGAVDLHIVKFVRVCVCLWSRECLCVFAGVCVCEWVGGWPCVCVGACVSADLWIFVWYSTLWRRRCHEMIHSVLRTRIWIRTQMNSHLSSMT